MHGLGQFLLFDIQELHCLQHFQHDSGMRYPQWNHITVQSFMFTSSIVSEVRLLKWKNNNNNNEKMNKTEQLVKET